MPDDDLRQTDANKRMTSEARIALADALNRVCKRGFYGSATITVQVKDGTIQAVLEATERKRR